MNFRSINPGDDVWIGSPGYPHLLRLVTVTRLSKTHIIIGEQAKYAKHFSRENGRSIPRSNTRIVRKASPGDREAWDLQQREKITKRIESENKEQAIRDERVRLSGLFHFGASVSQDPDYDGYWIVEFGNLNSAAVEALATLWNLATGEKREGE